MLKPVTLIGEQKKVLTLNPEGPIQIKGSAGSGKTTVALYRACHMMDTHTDMFEPTKVAIFTFNKSLSGYLSSLTHNLNERSYDGLNIVNFHKWAFAFLKQHGVQLYNTVIFESDIKNLVSNIVLRLRHQYPNELRILTKEMDFYVDEICWIKGKNIRSEQEYIETRRVGRGTSDRVTAQDKLIVWKVFTSYQEEKKHIGKCDFDDFALFCLDVLDKLGSDFTPPFTHIVIDEAQDLSKAQMMVLSRLISPTTNSLTIIADAAQRIYKSGFTWKEVGINVVGGRTIEFKKNYRNTEQIAKAAISLLEHDDDNGEFTTVEIGQRKGTKPRLVCE
ncbi:UvrD-helicase domain-containing protein [Vibrio campbellii]